MGTSSDLRPARNHDSRPIIIGLDFGTFSTKVLLRRRGEKEAQLVQLDVPAPGYPWFVNPSLVSLDRDRLHFGREASLKKTGNVFHSLKVRLLPPRSAQDSETDSFPVGLGPDFLVACYLAWTLQRIKVVSHDVASSPVFLNVAAPMDHIEDRELKHRYLRIVQAAWESCFGDNPIDVQQGAEAEELKQWFTPWLSHDVSVPDLTVRRFEVLPETVAPIVSLSRNPQMAPGMYMIVDMGAGTTELSVNHVGDRGADQKILCYADESNFLGASDFEFIDENIQQEPRLAERREKFLDDFKRSLKRTWYKGYKKDAPRRAARRRWGELTVLLTGGGAHRTEIGKAIELTSPMEQFFSEMDASYNVAWHRPSQISVPDEPIGSDPEEYALLSVAHGLSVPRQQWPEVFEPAEVEHLEREPGAPPSLGIWW